MEDYPSNSRNKTEKNLEAVVSGEVIRRRAPLGTRLRETFIGADATTVWGYVVRDVIVPAVKDMIADATNQGIERMLFGDSVRAANHRSSFRSNGPATGVIDYRKMSSDGRPEPRQERRPRTRGDFEQLIFSNRHEADLVLERLGDILEQYETASVADLCELTNLERQHTDNKWGWSDLRSARISRVQNGYLLDLPKPQPLD